MASGADLDKFVISIGSCHHSVVETRETIKETLLSRFATEAKDGNFPLVVHFDGKQLNQDFGGRRGTLSREVLVLTSPFLKNDVLVGAVPMETETGYAVATEMFRQLEDVGITDQVVMEVADSTRVNFGHQEGAILHLQNLLEKPLLAVECVHHTEELPAKKVMEVVSKRKSTSPEDKMFAKILEAWNEITDAHDDEAVYRVFDWEAHLGTGQEVAANEVLAWIKEGENEKQDRGDYTDCLLMISFFLGVFVIGFKIPRPGAISRARFLQVGRMYMIIFLLLDNPVVRRVLSEEEVQEVEIMAPYVALHYLPFMLPVPPGTLSPPSSG